MNKIIKKVILFSSIASFAAYTGYNLSNDIDKRTPCSIQSEDYSKIKSHSDRIVAHRGLTTMYVENSFDAVNAGFANDAVGTVEIDIQLTKDNEIVLFHDSKINNLTNGVGEIKNLTLRDIKSYEYYSRYLTNFTELWMNIDKDKKEQLKKDGYITNIATLDEILSINTNKTLLIDIKFDDSNAKFLIAKLAEKIKNYDGNMNFIFQGTNAKYLKTLRTLLSTYPFQIIISKEEEFEKSYKDFDMFAIKHSVLNRDMIDRINNDNKTLSVWTIKTRDEYEKIRDLDNQYNNIQYISDYPDCVGLWIENDLNKNANNVNKCLVKKK